MSARAVPSDKEERFVAQRGSLLAVWMDPRYAARQ
jgi:hypothetical protein